MTEFVVAAAFVLIPLFLIVPTVGKYIDMKLAAVQAARYTTWEYSAHYVNLNDQPGGFSAISSSQLPQKSIAQVKKEADRRFYSDTATPLNTLVDKSGYDNAAKNNLWTFHNGLNMYEETGTKGTPSGSKASPDKTVLVNALIGAIGTGLNYIASAYAALGINAGFDAINPDGNLTVDGRHSVSLILPVAEAPTYSALSSTNTKALFGYDLNLEMQAKSGLLTETWGAGGSAHSTFQSSGLIPTAILNNPVINTAMDIASTVLLAPELGSDSLRFGYPMDDPVIMDQVPVDALDPESRTVDCSGGYCEQ